MSHTSKTGCCVVPQCQVIKQSHSAELSANITYCKGIHHFWAHLFKNCHFGWCSFPYSCLIMPFCALPSLISLYCCTYSSCRLHSSRAASAPPALGGITTQLAALGCSWKKIDFESGKPDVPSLSFLSSTLFFGVGLSFAAQLTAVPSAVPSVLPLCFHAGLQCPSCCKYHQFGILQSCKHWKIMWEAEESAVIQAVCGDQRLLCLCLGENHRSTEGEGEPNLGRKQKGQMPVGCSLSNLRMPTGNVVRGELELPFLELFCSHLWGCQQDICAFCAIAGEIRVLSSPCLSNPSEQLSVLELLPLTLTHP